MNETTERAIDRYQLIQWVGVTGVLLCALAGMFGFHNASVWRLPVALREQVEVARYVHRLSTNVQQERAEVLRRTHGVLSEADGQAFEHAMDNARRLQSHG